MSQVLGVRVLTLVRTMLWIGVCDALFQFLPISRNFAEPLKRRGPQSTLCERDVSHLMPIARSLKTCDTRGIMWYDKTAHIRVTVYCDQPKAHLFVY